MRLRFLRPRRVRGGVARRFPWGASEPRFMGSWAAVWWFRLPPPPLAVLGRLRPVYGGWAWVAAVPLGGRPNRIGKGNQEWTGYYYSSRISGASCGIGLCWLFQFIFCCLISPLGWVQIGTLCWQGMSGVYR